MLQRQLDQRYASLTAAKDKQNALLLQQKDATVHALNQEKRASRLQEALIVLIIVLAAVMATLAWRGRQTSRAMRTLAMTDELTGVRIAAKCSRSWIICFGPVADAAC